MCDRKAEVVCAAVANVHSKQHSAGHVRSAAWRPQSEDCVDDVPYMLLLLASLAVRMSSHYEGGRWDLRWGAGCAGGTRNEHFSEIGQTQESIAWEPFVSVMLVQSV